jgi:phage terminase small subunit
VTDFLKPQPKQDIDWVDLEIDYRLGDLSVEEIALQYGVQSKTIEERAVAGDWHQGYDTDAVHPKYVRLVEEYMTDWNKSASLLRAGFPSTLYKSVWRNPKVANLLKQRMKEASVRSRVSTDTVISGLARIAQFDIRKLYDEQGNLLPIHLLDDDTAYAVQAIEVLEGRADDGSTVTYNTKKVKTEGKQKALESLGKHLGLFTERVEHTGKDGGAIKVEDVTNPEDAARRIAFLLTKATHNKE